MLNPLRRGFAENRPLSNVVRMPPGPLAWREVPERLLSAPSKGLVVAFAMLFLCLAALFMTSSRGAVVTSLLALIVGFVGYFWRHLSGGGGIFAAIASCGAVALILLQVMGRPSMHGSMPAD